MEARTELADPAGGSPSRRSTLTWGVRRCAVAQPRGCAACVRSSRGEYLQRAGSGELRRLQPAVQPGRAGEAPPRGFREDWWLQPYENGGCRVPGELHLVLWGTLLSCSTGQLLSRLPSWQELAGSCVVSTEHWEELGLSCAGGLVPLCLSRFSLPR